MIYPSSRLLKMESATRFQDGDGCVSLQTNALNIYIYIYIYIYVCVCVCVCVYIICSKYVYPSKIQKCLIYCND